VEELIRELERWATETSMGYTERFETQAELFYRETGLMAPGKSLPLEMPQDDAKRRTAWDEWQGQRRIGFINTLQVAADALTRLQAERDALAGRVETLREALQGLVGLHDDPTPYDSATTIAAARAALADAARLVQLNDNS